MCHFPYQRLLMLHSEIRIYFQGQNYNIVSSTPTVFAESV